MWKNVVEPDGSQMTIWRMRISWWIPRAKNTYSEYVIRIVFPLQQQLHKCTSLLRYAYIACLVVCTVQLQSKGMLVTVLYGSLFSVCKNILYVGTVSTIAQNSSIGPFRIEV